MWFWLSIVSTREVPDEPFIALGAVGADFGHLGNGGAARGGNREGRLGIRQPVLLAAGVPAWPRAGTASVPATNSVCMCGIWTARPAAASILGAKTV
jgi:hypothetical protein